MEMEQIIVVLIAIAFITLAERKILGSMQRRQGPIKQGPKGLLQSISDGIKLVLKESIIPKESESAGIFKLSPIIGLSISLILWLFIPIFKTSVILDDKLTIIVIYAITSIGVYSVLYSGWSSNSKYGIMGTLRSTSQLLSYEISIGIIFLNVIIVNETFNILELAENQIFSINLYILFPIFVLFLFSMLAETFRSPFDIVEAESELVAGNLVEYGGMSFAGMYLAEYSNIILMSTLCSIFFFNSFFLNFLFIFFFIWIRATLPRLRWDALLLLGWTKILPLSLGYLLFLCSILTINF